MKPRNIALVLSSLILVTTIIVAGVLYHRSILSILSRFHTPSDNTKYETLEERASAAEKFAQRHHLSEDYCFFIDYGIPSGTPRMFVWSFKENKIVKRIHVMHGPGRGSTAAKPVFSNSHGSNCSSLGRFAVTKHHGHKIRRSYRLKGYDKSNRAAFSRGLMIHSSSFVDRHCRDRYIPLDSRSCRGCVTVSTWGLDYLEKMIEHQKQPMLLWSYRTQ